MAVDTFFAFIGVYDAKDDALADYDASPDGTDTVAPPTV